MIKKIKASTLLSNVQGGDNNIFGFKYNMNLYRGCQHGCIYCDSRSSCYRIENFSDILIKENAIELLDRELKSKRIIGTIGTGSMNDPYMPVEREVGLTRKALEVINKYGFPVHIITKSNLVLRDLDILKKINNKYAAVSITITTTDDNLSLTIEPGAPKSSIRFETIKSLSNEGIYTGITLMPVLPYITDSEINIREMVLRAKEAGAKYIMPCFGVTLRDVQRDYYYIELIKKFPGLREKYLSNYENSYFCPIPEYKKISYLFNELCSKHGISTKMDFYNDNKQEQLSFDI
jgi:DNA repair photolyase